MRKVIYVAAAAAMLSVATPAQASGGGQNGPVGVGVIGEKLKVKEVRATLDGWYPGAQARVSLWQKKRVNNAWRWQRVETVRGWKYTQSREIANWKHEYAAWQLNNRAFPNNSRICTEFKHRSERACATIHN